MSESKEKKARVLEEEDLISNLPDALLGAIVSRLPGMEGVRTSILSHRWETVWKYSSNLNFDQKYMLRDLIEDCFRSSDLVTRLTRAVNRKDNTLTLGSNMDAIAEVGMLITSIIVNHIGPLQSCSIKHLPECCADGEAGEWIIKLMDKGAKKVLMEVECPRNSCVCLDGSPNLIERGRALNLSFEVFGNFEVLELINYRLVISPSYNSPKLLKILILNHVHFEASDFQEIVSHSSSLENLTLDGCHSIGSQLEIVNQSLIFFKISKMYVRKILVSAINIEVMEIDSISCRHEELAFEIPKLQVLRSYNDNKGAQMYFAPRNNYLTTKDIFEIFGGITSPLASRKTNIFENLVTLSIDFSLKNNRNVIALSSALKSCHHLKNLLINNQVNGWMHDMNEDDFLPYPRDFFWLRREPCECVNHQLESLCIKEYTGKDYEMEFVKYIITNAGVIKMITLWFIDDCLWDEAIATMCLLSFPKASPNLSINLKPGKEYMKSVDGNFEKWVTTLPH